MVLLRNFYLQDTATVAKQLLGKRLVRVMDDGTRLAGIICETEAYLGETDTACHASKSRTARTEVLYGAPGLAYVYFTYGMHFLLNVVTQPQGYAEAVLIRGIIPEDGLVTMRALRQNGKKNPLKDKDLTNGPGKVTQAMHITKGLHNELDLTLGKDLWVEDAGKKIPASKIRATPRIGINYATPKDRDALLRFELTN